jgi:hypothetical protein
MHEKGKSMLRGLVVLCLCPAVPSAARPANKTKQLGAALKAKWDLAHMGIDRLRITQLGTILVIRQEGTRANPSIDLGNVTDKVVDGHVQGPRGFEAAFFSNQRHRCLKAGTTLYVTRISVRSKQVRFDIVTCDTSDINVSGNTRHMRYAATLAFELSEGLLQTADTDAVKKAVGTVLLPQTEVKAANTKTISLGQTIEQVKASLGAPDRVANLSPKAIYIYKDMKVIFMNGKASDVERRHRMRVKFATAFSGTVL